ncbi:hypothetical protein [Methanofollis ethanolicus]|uniref:hypothetical protein n=1 Tax=Methanofollis ethanolicus TaxID=488124 RepID=UPI00082BA23B|nr:hypothetical protein [Methanofollis ethanolicus]
MTLTRKDFIVTLASLFVAWLGLTLVWLGVVDETSPVALVLVLGGMIGIFFPALQQTYQDDLATFPADIVRRAWYVGVVTGAVTIVVFVALREAMAGDPKLHALLSLPVAVIAGIFVLMVTEKGVLRISRKKNRS